MSTYGVRKYVVSAESNREKWNVSSLPRASVDFNGKLHFRSTGFEISPQLFFNIQKNTNLGAFFKSRRWKWSLRVEINGLFNIILGIRSSRPCPKIMVQAMKKTKILKGTFEPVFSGVTPWPSSLFLEVFYVNSPDVIALSPKIGRLRAQNYPILKT